tara:strand:- start:123 stop:425 length:303 start_codon:yes stop_codon:yes gene_type:complete
MKKKIIFISLFIIFFILSIQLIFQIKRNFNTNIEKNSNKDKSDFNNKKKYLVECKLFNEIIDRKKIDNERQCYYSCSEDDNVRVDTSIGFPCQPYILEER